MRTIIFTVSETENGFNVLRFLKSRGISRSAVIELKKIGGITRSGLTLRTSDLLSPGDRVTVSFPETGSPLVPNPDIKCPVVSENEDYVVFDKPANLAVHPSVSHYSDTLGNLFAALYPDRAFRPVNRLDKNTSGLVLCAKNMIAAPILSRTAEKTYYAAVSGELREPGKIDVPISRAPDSIIKREANDSGKPAVTLYKPILSANGRTLLEIKLITGRTHQIRVHFSHIGFPLCGDELYGGDCAVISRQALHCGKISFSVPFSDGKTSLESPLPDDIGKLFFD